MSTGSYYLPNLLALLPKKPGGEINPHFEGVESAFNIWVENKFGGSRAMVARGCDIPLGISYAYPLASHEQLRGIIDYTAAGLVLDDVLDRSPSEDVPTISQLWMETFLDGGGAKGFEHPLVEMMRSELLLGIRPFVGSFHWSQFIVANKTLLMHMGQETHDCDVSLSEKMTLDIQSYTTRRRMTVATCVYFVFVRHTRCLYIPDEVLASPIVRDMENAASDMLFISNDIYSFKKEYVADGAFNNILTVIQNDPETAHLDFQGRLDYAGELFKAALRQFHACKQELSSFGPDMSQCLAMYADGMIDVVTGNLQWSRVVPRYRTFMNDEDRQRNVMRLALAGFPANEKNLSTF